MMWDMWAAIALSVGNKAKARDKHGEIVVVERHYSRIQYAFILHIITNGSGDSCGFDGRIGELTDVLIDRHGINPSAIAWLPVETPFLDEVKEQVDE